MEYSIDIIIPTYKPDATFEKLISRLQRQTVKPQRILVINTEEALWEQAEFDKSPFVFGTLAGMKMELYHIRKEEFDHGGTRAWAAGKSQAEYLMFMTQDAMPADQYLIERLLRTMTQDPMIGAAYARQLPTADCGMIERYTREFNYGENSLIKTAEDIPQMGIKTFFCSDVCAMYRRNIYLSVGGFVRHTIFNEDMICAGTMIQKGYKVAYAADARVIHSHNYTAMEQFHRNFDLGVSQAEHPEVFEGVPSEGEGIRLVKKSMAYLVRTGHIWLIPGLFFQSASKYAGYFLGKRYQKLPEKLILSCTMSPYYWKKRR